MLTLGKCEVVETYDRKIRTSHVAVKMPAVIRLVHTIVKRKQRIKYGKLSIFARDRWTCQYCGQEKNINELTRDHVLPKAQGGRSNWENVVAACQTCNADKGNRTPQQAGMALLTKPRKPTWIPLLTVRIGRAAMPPPWKPYCYS